MLLFSVIQVDCTVYWIEWRHFKGRLSTHGILFTHLPHPSHIFIQQSKKREKSRPHSSGGLGLLPPPPSGKIAPPPSAPSTNNNTEPLTSGSNIGMLWRLLNSECNWIWINSSTGCWKFGIFAEQCPRHTSIASWSSVWCLFSSDLKQTRRPSRSWCIYIEGIKKVKVLSILYQWEHLIFICE